MRLNIIPVKFPSPENSLYIIIRLFMRIFRADGFEELLCNSEKVAKKGKIMWDSINLTYLFLH